MTQDEALKILKTGANVFLTGEPGSGKTYTVNAFCRWLDEHGIESAITASTGIAATHIGGYTIHSWSGIGIKRELSPRDIDAIAQNKRVADRVGGAKILIIDEVSMLSAATLSSVDAVCREVRRNQKPFGGLQVVLVGDFFQLPPIVSREEGQKKEQQRALFSEATGDARFAFRSSAWAALNPLTCYLSEQHRQDDAAFLSVLQGVRRGSFSEEHRALLRTRYAKRAPDGVAQLYSHNNDVDRINNAELEKLSTQARVFEMEEHGPENLVLPLKRGCLSPETLTLKLGARVLFTKNDYLTYKYVNGTLGRVTGFVKETGYPIVATREGRTIFVEPSEWALKDGDRVLARIIQFPLRLAWAITVHKSQGMSLDAAHMDLSDVFEYGQGYVALSRVRTLGGLSLQGLNARAVEVHPEISAKDTEFRIHSEAAREAFAKISAEELTRMHADFIRACGGKSGKEKGKKKQKTKARNEPSWKRSVTLSREGKDIEQIARELGFTQSTIVTHLAKARKNGVVNPSDITHLARGREKEFAKIHEAFGLLGIDMLKPVFEHLNGRVSYDTLRLARLLYEK